MKTSKPSNYRWLLDAGHYGWDNPKRQRMNSEETVTLLADMLKNARIDFFRVSPVNRDTPLNKRISIVKELHARNKRCIYLSLQINNRMNIEPHIGVAASIASHDRAVAARIGDLLDQIYGPVVKPNTPVFDFQHMKGSGMGKLDELVKAKCPAILVTYFLPGGAQFTIRKMVRRRIAQGLLKVIRAIEKHEPV